MRHDQQHDEHFREFIAKLGPIIAEHGKNTAELQKHQVERLVTLEKRFRMMLVRHKWGPDAYKAFIDHILVVKRNILMARPYFRERDTTFKASISPVLKEKDHLRLYQFNINYQFIDFVLKQMPWGTTKAGQALMAIAEKVKDIRKELAECNLPLAISQARMFLERNSRSHLNYMDMNQTCFVGLLEGIDKYVGPYHRRFRAVLIGRMLGNLIESNSETFIHFFPPDKRRIYRARKIIGRMGHDGPLDLEEVCKRLNEVEQIDNKEREVDRLEQEKVDGIVKKSKPDPMTSVGDLVNLLSAAQVLHSSSLPMGDDEDGSNLIEKYPARDEWRPDIVVQEAEARRVVSDAIQGLSLLDRKLLRLKGIEL
jgi:hypothetical protein